MTNKKENKDDSIESRTDREILEALIDSNKKIYHKIKRIDNYIFWQKIFSVVKIIIIVVPIAIMIIILPPMLNNLMDQYRSILGITEMTEEINLENINPEEAKKLLEKLK